MNEFDFWLKFWALVGAVVIALALTAGIYNYQMGREYLKAGLAPCPIVGAERIQWVPREKCFDFSR